MRFLRGALATALFLLLGSTPAVAQYIYLDTNGDGVNTLADTLSLSGVTNLDIWLVTNANRDGSPVTCSQDPEGTFDFFSYEIVLRAVGGTVHWGSMQNRLPFDYGHGVINFAAGAADTTGDTEYHNGYGCYDPFGAGRHLLATLPVWVTSGSPSIVFEPFSPSRPVSLTSFGTYCPSPEWDWTFKLGVEFHDADGVGSPTAVAGGPYHGFAGEALTLSGAASADPHAAPLSYQWDFGDGTHGQGVTVAHAYAVPGTYPVTLTVSNGAARGSDATTATVVSRAAVVPVADPGGPYRGAATEPVQFDGSASTDPNGDALSFRWDFGDGATEAYMAPQHRYASPGTYPVRLSVSDGLYTGTAATTAEIADVPPRVLYPVPGGPYAGYVGRAIQFNGGGSSDSYGEIPGATWDFGDGVSGTGLYASHAYAAPGSYRVGFTLSAGSDVARATTGAVVQAHLPARAFTTDANAVYDLTQKTETLEIQLEPGQNAFRVLEVDPARTTLRSTTDADAPVITASLARSYAGDDTDGNGVVEATLVFMREDLDRLFADLKHTTDVPLEVEGALAGGGSAVAPATIHVVVPEGSLAAQVTPNPFNPTGTIRFDTAVPGRLRAEVFDLRGRLVRVLLDEQAAPAGRYALRVGPGELASGIYFFRIATAQRVLRGRFVIAK
jgi:PKD repeat protein